MLVVLLLGLVASCAGHPDPAKLFEPVHLISGRRLPELTRIAGEAMSTTAKEQGAIVIDQFLAKTEDQCLARAMCQYGASKKQRSLDKIEEGIQDSLKKLEELLNNAWSYLQKQYATLIGKEQKTSALGQVVGAVEVGELMGEETCRALFECKQDFSPQARTTCDGRALVCPGFAIGCAMCGLYAPAVCGSTCTVAALYCNFGAYACAADAET